MNKTYHIRYLLDGVYSEERGVDILAPNKATAYDWHYEVIFRKEGKIPYAAWVSSVTYQNGNYHQFKTFAGKPI